MKTLRAQLLGFLVASACCIATARAGDYAVGYAIDANGVQETGKLECDFRSSCEVKIERLAMNLRIYASEARDRSATVELRGPPGCCVLSSKRNRWGADIDTREQFHTLPIAEGRPSRKLEFVLNRGIGTLYLGFSYPNP
jgi:hypothetical protein